MMLKVEGIFRGYEEKALLLMSNLKETLITRAENLLKDVALPTCHEVKRKLLSKYFNVRLSIFCKMINSKYTKSDKGKADLGSRSVAMRNLMNKYK